MEIILIIHQKAHTVVRVEKKGRPVVVQGSSCTDVFWELVDKFPEEWIGWCEESTWDSLLIENWNEIFHHDLIMASYAVKTNFIPESIGYVDQFPFVNIRRDVQYTTWRMSSDVGAIKGKAAIKFKNLLQKLFNFEYLLNSMAKVGQQNGLFCYSSPKLIKGEAENKIEYKGTERDLFKFVQQHYKNGWIYLLFWCLLRNENKFPIDGLFLSLFKSKYFQKKVSLSEISIISNKKTNSSENIDVIVPTIGRPGHLIQVVEDLSKQTLLPKKVIIVEQNPDLNSTSELKELLERDWPFSIKHKFIHRTGVCNARNLGLREVNSDWIFFCDDDNRIEPAILQSGLSEIKRFGVAVLNTAYLQPNETVIFDVVKQWGTFGSGNSIVNKESLGNSVFSEAFEHGYGEDADFGMQLRYLGNDIIYHPAIEIVHLKAPMGGFRKKPDLPWEQESLLPKPSPTVMAFALKHYSPEQIKGYKVSLFLKYYRHQEIMNPIKYLRELRKRWHLSEKWARWLLQKDAAEVVTKSAVP